MSADEDYSETREQTTARVVAVADVYVITNRIRDLVEQRLEAIERAVQHGATEAELAAAMGGAEL